MKTMARNTRATLPPSEIVGPVVVLHELYRLKKSPLKEAGPAAVVYESNTTLREVVQEAMLVAACRPTWSTPRATSGDGEWCPTTNAIFHEDHCPSADEFEKEYAQSLLALPNDECRECAVDLTRWRSTANKSQFGIAICNAIRSGATVIFLANCREYFADGDLCDLAARWLAATYGTGAVYRNKAKT